MHYNFFFKIRVHKPQQGLKFSKSSQAHEKKKNLKNQCLIIKLRKFITKKKVQSHNSSENPEKGKGHFKSRSNFHDFCTYPKTHKNSKIKMGTWGPYQLQQNEIFMGFAY